MMVSPDVTLLHASGTATRRGHNLLIAAPGEGIRITLIGMTFQLEGKAAVLRLVNGKLGSIIWKAVMVRQGDGISLTFPIDQRPRLNDNVPLILNLSKDTAVGYTIWYYLNR